MAVNLIFDLNLKEVIKTALKARLQDAALLEFKSQTNSKNQRLG